MGHPASECLALERSRSGCLKASAGPGVVRRLLVGYMSGNRREQLDDYRRVGGCGVGLLHRGPRGTLKLLSQGLRIVSMVR